MADFREFNFSGTPGNPHKISIDLDKIISFNECCSTHGFKYDRTMLFVENIDGTKLEHVTLDMEYKDFKKIMDEKFNK